MPITGGYTGGPLDFSNTGKREIAGQRMEPKVCEWGCGGTFIRPVPVMARYGQKVCPGCLKRNERIREERRKGTNVLDESKGFVRC